MGHLILIADDTLKFLARCPADLLDVVSATFDQSAWDGFVNGPFKDAKARDATVMGGGKPHSALPDVSGSVSGASAEDDSDSDEEEGAAAAASRATLVRTFGFGSGEDRDQDDDTDATTHQVRARSVRGRSRREPDLEQFTRYMQQEMKAGPSDSRLSDEDDEDEWIDGGATGTDPFGARSSSGFDAVQAQAAAAFDDDVRAHSHRPRSLS